MRDRGKIAVGLSLFLAAVLLPLWYPRTLGQPNLVLPEHASACIESTATMRARHMKLLDDWRTSVVRAGARDYVATNGARYEKSLSRTCMRCHTSASRFCTSCHVRLAIQLNCWDCHVAPEGRAR